MVSQIVSKQVGDADIPERVLQLIAEYNCYALLGFFLKFLWNHMDWNIDESVDQISYIFEGNVQWILERQEDHREVF